MFKSLDSNNSIPNNYVYTSNRGTEYMYLDDSWVNCETMKIVENAHTFKMNQSAIRQIAEHNKNNSLQIGKKYVINESSYTYVGRNNYSFEGNLLSENMNKRVQRLVEAESTKPGQVNDKIPNYYETTFGNNNTRYFYKDGWWINQDSENKQAVHNEALSNEITSDALSEIEKHDNDPKSVFKIGQKLDFKGTEVYYNGHNFVSSDGKKLPYEFTQKMEEQAKSGNNSEDTEAQDQEDSTPTQDVQGATSDVPNGYVYKSRKGNSYYKKNGQWMNSSTKKPVSSSSVPMLERAAQAEITRFNATSPIQIGKEFTSKKGVTYRYVGGNRFISDSGKLLPPDISQKLIANAGSQDSQGDSSQEEQPQDATQDSPQDQSTDTPAEEQPEQGGGSTDGADPLQGLADEIKSNPEARRIIVLMSRNDPVSLLAADILLSGQQKEAADIIKSLNNED